jgi:hypothetical protein
VNHSTPYKSRPGLDSKRSQLLNEYFTFVCLTPKEAKRYWKIFPPQAAESALPALKLRGVQFTQMQHLTL